MFTEVDERSPAAGRSGKVVWITYSFEYEGRLRTGMDLFQPRKPFGLPGWSPEERAAAQRFVADNPPGKSVGVVVSRYLPWHSKLLRSNGAADEDQTGRTWISVALALFFYAVAAIVGCVWRALPRAVKQRR